MRSWRRCRPMVAPTIFSLFIAQQEPLPAFFAGRRRKESYQRNAKRKRGLFEKSPLSIPQKLFGDCCRNVWRVHPTPRASLSAPPPAVHPTDSGSPAAGGRKNFSATHTGHWAGAPKVTYQPIRPAARRCRDVRCISRRAPISFSKVFAGVRGRRLQKAPPARPHTRAKRARN